MDGGSLAQVRKGVGPGIWNRPNPGAQTIEIAGIVLKQAWLDSAGLVNHGLWALRDSWVGSERKYDVDRARRPMP